MVAAKINNVRVNLATLGGQISEDAWVLVRRALAELDDAEDCAKRMANMAHLPDLPLFEGIGGVSRFSNPESAPTLLQIATEFAHRHPL